MFNTIIKILLIVLFVLVYGYGDDSFKVCPGKEETFANSKLARRFQVKGNSLACKDCEECEDGYYKYNALFPTDIEKTIADSAFLEDYVEYDDDEGNSGTCETKTTTTTSTTTSTTPTTITTTPQPPIRPPCRHYTQGALYYDKYSCHCGSTNETDVKINKCCNEHHECLNELLKECPSIPPAKHFVDIDTTKYMIDAELFESRKEIKCLEKDPCKKKLCECDRSAAECWTQIASIPDAGPLCFACYFDEGRKLAKDPIATFVYLRKIFLEETLKVKNATNMIKNGEVAANSEYVNSTILSAVFVVRNGHGTILDAEEEYAQIMSQTIGFLNPVFNNTEDAKNNNNNKELSDYSSEAAYNFTLARVTLLEFEKEKFATYELGEIALKTIEELEEVISENS